VSVAVNVWRIGTDTADYEADDLNGIGAEKAGGRWNTKGNAVVYCATTIALACLETVVHMDDSALPLNRYLVQIQIPLAVWKRRTIWTKDTCPVGWDALPQGRVSLRLGDAWLKACDSAVMVVPSVVVPEELNVLINPKHKDKALVRAQKVRKWHYDSRMF
jgi:RES domain-containing protein